MYDKDKNGKISAKELYAEVLKSLGEKCTMKDCGSDDQPRSIRTAMAASRFRGVQEDDD
ncbi:hypothetical protein Scep_022946 [Stephania cephalantha]|uniref:EF-hand domain-containing protein n=1 Tax=Stephania cephalantha TaxID=152367 RepID=A0AAP0F909_9MAGN